MKLTKKISGVFYKNSGILLEITKREDKTSWSRGNEIGEVDDKLSTQLHASTFLEKLR